MPLVVAPKCWLGGLNHQEVYLYYGVSYHMFAFLFERTFLVIHCKTRLWSLLLTLIGSWTAPSLWSRYSISLRYISYFIFLLLCFSLVVVFGARISKKKKKKRISFWSLLLTLMFGWCFYKFLQLLLWFQQSAYQIIHPLIFFFFPFLSHILSYT